MMKAGRLSISPEGEIAFHSNDQRSADRFADFQIAPEFGEANAVQLTDIDLSDHEAIAHWNATDCKGELHVIRSGELGFDIQQKLVAQRDVAFASVGLLAQLKLLDASVLDSRYRLSRPRRIAHIDAWTPLAITGRIGGRFVQLVGVDRPVATILRKTAGHSIRLTAFLDHELAHPRFHFDSDLRRHWRSRYELPAGSELLVSFRVLLTPDPRPLIVPGRLPGCCRAAMAIADHADHDTCEKFRALLYGAEDEQSGSNRGFAGLKLPFTKSVFSATQKEDGAGLHNSEFKAICAEAERVGIEICPHGIHQMIQPPANEVSSLLSCFRSFDTRSWIDHGFSFRTTYVKEGWDSESDYFLIPHLDELNIKYLWGFLDFGQAVPGRNLDQLQIGNYSACRFARDLFRLTVRAAREWKPWVILHGMSVVLFQLLPDGALSRFFKLQLLIAPLMRHGKFGKTLPAIVEFLKLLLFLIKPSSIREMYDNFFGPRSESLPLTPLLFPEHGSVRASKFDKWLFNTVSVHDVADAYSPECIDRLIDDFGVHFAHTYLGSISSAHISHALQERDGTWRLAPRFESNLKYIARQRDTGQLWFAPVSKIADGMRWQRQLKIIPNCESWTVCLPNEAMDTDFDFVQIVAFGGVAGSLSYHDETAVTANNIDSERSLVQLAWEKRRAANQVTLVQGRQ